MSSAVRTAPKLLVLLVALWTGVVLCIALIAAPAAFAVLPRADAGLVAAQLFKLEAYGSVLVGTVAWILMRGDESHGAAKWGMWGAVLAALICTIVGYFGLIEQMQSIKAEKGAASAAYLRLHGVSMVLYAVKALAWFALSALAVRRLAPLKNRP